MDRAIPVKFGRRFTGATVLPDGRICAAFDDGTEAIGDLLVGADGVHSRVRQVIDPTAPAGRYVGLTNFGGFTPGAGRDIEPEAWHLNFGRRAFFGYHATPAGDVVWFANVPRPAISPTERETTSEFAWRRQLSALFADDHGPAVSLIEAGRLELAADNTHDLGHVPTWHRGPMVLVGDAAHAPAPSSGQGASMAIEDAVVLAQTLRRSPTIAEAFAAYERVAPRARREDRGLGRSQQQQQDAGRLRSDRSGPDAAVDVPLPGHAEVACLDVRLSHRLTIPPSRRAPA